MCTDLIAVITCKPNMVDNSTADVMATTHEMLPGLSYLTIKIGRIGIKNPQNYLDPHITVSVKSEPLEICYHNYFIYCMQSY